MEDCYKTIGTSKEAIDRIKKDEIDSFIREKYEDAKKRLERKITLTTLPEKKEQIEQQLKQINNAYKKVKDEFARRMYVREQEEGEEGNEENNAVQIKRKTPFEILEINEQDIILMPEKEQDECIREQKENLLKECNQKLEDLPNSRFTDKMKLTRRIQEIEEAYNEVKDEEIRSITIEHIQKERQEEEKRQKEKEIKETYCHISEYDTSLIDRTAKLKGLMAIRKEVDGQEVSYSNKHDQEIKVRKIARIFYCTSLGLKSYVNEFEIKRRMPEEEKVDVVKTGLDLDDLSLIQPEGRDCIINRLLSEDLILASKYNAGYIGEIEKITEEINNVKVTNYDVTLKRKRLTPNEREMLTAIMIIEERKQREQENKGVAK